MMIRLTSSFAVIALSALLVGGCGAPPSQSSQPGTGSPPLTVPNPAASNTGTIKVTSEPPGAAVMLIEEDEGGAGFPKPSGSAPTTVTGVSPGKYTVHLELRGYKSFQKSVEVKAGESVEVKARLKK